jgi:hypothetical protein
MNCYILGTFELFGSGFLPAAFPVVLQAMHSDGGLRRNPVRHTTMWELHN